MSVSRRSLALLVTACAFALVGAACGGDGERSAEDVPPDAIALIGDQEVPESEFQAIIDRAEKSYKAQKRPFPKVGSPEYQDLKNRAVSFLVQRYQFRAEAEEMGIEVTEEDIDKRLAKVTKESFEGDEAKLTKELERIGLSQEQAREQLRDLIIQEKIFEEVTKNVKVTDAQVRAYYKKNEAQFKRPASRDVRHILFQCAKPAECEKAKAEADRVRDQLVNGNGDFAALAKQHSDDPGSKAQGGKYAAVKGQSVAPFDKVAFELDVGEISQPVKTQFGWHIIEALAPVKPEAVTPLSEVEDSIRKQLLDQKKNEVMQKWVKDLEKEYEGEITYAVGFAPPKTETGTTTTTG